MNSWPVLFALAWQLAVAWPVCGQVSFSTNDAAGIAIPDGDFSGLVRSVEISTPLTRITNLTVTLNVADGYNGDIYAYLVHDSGFAMLLNRPGKTQTNAFGYGDPGFQVTLDDHATNGDIHVYRRALSGSDSIPLAGPLTNVWAPDGRDVDPDLVQNTNARTALLDSFNGQNPNGQWVLFVADLSFVFQSTLVSWGLHIQGVSGDPPTIATNPANQLVECPGNATFHVAVSGTPPIGFQWFSNTTALVEATNDTLTLHNLSLAASGSSFAVVVTNGFGSITSSPAILTVQDTTPPSLSCPAPVVTNTAPGQCGQTVVFTVTAADVCEGALASTCTPTSGSVFAAGIHLVNCAAFDSSHNTNTCSFVVTVLDVEPPVIACPSDLTATNDLNQCSAVVDYVIGGSDNCGVLSTNQLSGLASGSAFPVGKTTNTFQVTDAAGNTTTCSFVVTVIDAQPPVIACPSDVTTTNDLSQCSAVVNYAVNGSDICGAVSTNQLTGLASGSAFPVGKTTNTFQVTDAAGNTATCSFVVTVTDTQPPVIACPSDLTTTNDLNQCSAVVDYVIGGSDNCAAVSTNQLSGLASGSAFPVGKTTNTFQVTDAAGNTATCRFVVTVTDTQPPVIACPSDLTTTNDLNQCSAVVDYVIGGSDNCAVVSTNQLSGLASGSAFPVGKTTNTFQVTDAAGNTATCSFVVTVTDAQPPQITCPSDITVNADAGQCSKSNVTFTATTTDNCPGVAVVCVPPSGSIFAVGTNTVVCTATDGSGNSAQCGFAVVVKDTQAPAIISCAAARNLTVDTDTCLAQVPDLLPEIVASDNCGSFTLTQSPTNGASIGVGVTSVLITARDAAGNEATCSTALTVIDPVTNLWVTIELQGVHTLVSWPQTCDPAWKLWQTPALAPPSWTQVTNSVVPVGNRNTLNLDASTGNLFLRLKKP